ncbi:hypothetical protein M422DRAFT_179967 [Sphaerobolus stellatus SS14]|uniref:Large-conductance mechanosensitive channel n=1 Tax=Sphaerobolus stellatus (strain SS14) TaxID=990650 RepID=A0A0C9V2R0_SPHS4|nr:hypothetical protein M422DRAFT_179967 [Sphaerobolus stellatus SS14]
MTSWAGFVNFALRDNVLEVAIGLIIASAFTKVVNSLVSDILLPFLSLLPFMSRNLDEKFIVLRRGPHYTKPQGYNTRKQAISDGAVLWTYGAFLDETIAFFGLGLTLYLMANLYGYFSKESIIKHVYKCSYCRKQISVKAKRCPLCTTWLDGREDRETSAL